MLEDLIINYGYLAIIIGTFLEGETIVLLGGLAAHNGLLQVEYVILAAFCGSFSGDQVWFTMGRRWGNNIIRRWPKWEKRVNRVHVMMEKYHDWIIVLFRFFYGIRNVTPIALGMSNVKRLRFALLNGLGAAVWATSFGAGGYVFGAAMEQFIGKAKHYQQTALIALASVFILWWLYRVIFGGKKDNNSTGANATRKD